MQVVSSEVLDGKPVISGPKRYTGEEQFSQKLFTAPEISPKDIERASPLLSVVNPLYGVTHGLSPRTADVAASGATNTVMGFANMLNTNEGVLALGTGGLPKDAQAAVGLAFAAHAIKDSPEAVMDFLSSKTDDERAQNLTRLLGNLAIGTGGVLHGFGRPVSPVAGEQPPETPTGPHKEIVDTAKAELARQAEKTYEEVQPALQNLPGETQDKVRSIIEKQGRGEDLSANEQATLLQVQSYAGKNAESQPLSSGEAGTQPAGTPPAEVPPTKGIAAIPSSEEGGRASAFAQALREQGAPLTAEALSVPPVAKAPVSLEEESAFKRSDDFAEEYKSGRGSNYESAISEIRSFLGFTKGEATFALSDEDPRGAVEAVLSHNRGGKQPAESPEHVAAYNEGVGQADKFIRDLRSKYGLSPIIGPAMLDSDGNAVAKGEIGQRHADLIRDAVTTGNVDAVTGEHGFHDAEGKSLTRTEAADRALATGQIDQTAHDKAMSREGAGNVGLHSEDLMKGGDPVEKENAQEDVKKEREVIPEPATGQPGAQVSPDPQATKMVQGLKKLGKVSRDPAATIEDELGRYSDEERAQLQKHLGAADAEPETLAEAVAGKGKIPETKKGSSYVDEPSAEARSDSPEVEALKDWTSATEGAPKGMKRGSGEAGAVAVPKVVADIARAAGEAITKPRQMSELDQATTNRSAKQQKSFDEAQRATKEITKTIPSLRRRSAVSVWLEADGDATKLASWEAGAKGELFKQAVKDAQTLTPEEIAIAQKVQGAFEVLRKRGEKFEVLKSGRDNYVPHVWDLSEGKTGLGGGGKLQQNLKFAKARTLENFAAGDAAGMKPKTLDIAKLLPAYLTEMNKVIADRQFVQDMSEWTASDGRPLVVARGRVGASVSPEGDYAYLVNPDAATGLKDAQGNPVDTSDYRVMENQLALHDWNFKKSDLQGNPIFMKDDLAVHPEAYKRIHAMLGRSALKDIPLVKAYDKLQSVMKREMFSLLAPFHQVQEGTHGIAHRVSPVSGLEQVDMRKPEMYDAAQHGLMLLPDRSTSAGYMEGLGGTGTFLTKTLRWLGEKSDAAGKAELAGKGATALADVVDGYQNYLFHQYIPAMKFKTYQAALERNRATYAPELKSGKMSDADVKLTTAEQVNAAYGHLNRALLDRNPTDQHLREMTLLAPDFLEARARFVGQAAKGAVGAKVGREQFKALAFMALVQAGSAFTISQLMGVKYDPKKPFSVVSKGREYSLRSVPEDMLRFGSDVKSLATGGDKGVPFLSARENPLLASVGEFLSGKNYRGEKTNAKETTEELLAKYIPITARAIPAIRNLTETSRNNPVSPLEQLAGSLGLKISRVSPINETYAKASQWMEHQGIPKDKGSYPVSKYQKLRYALEDGDLDKAANEIARLKKTEKTSAISKGFRESVLHDFTKTKEMDRKFRASLSESDKAIFDLAVENRRGILHKFNAIPDSGLPYVSSSSSKGSVVKLQR